MSNEHNEWTAEAAEAEAEQLDVAISTEGARHVPFAELREKQILQHKQEQQVLGELRDAVAEGVSSLIAPGSGEFLCEGETRVKRNYVNHTHRCTKPAGHEGGHEWSDGAGRTIIWYGEVKPLPVNMRYRFGLNPHWQMERQGRKVMASDYDSEW